MPYMLIMFGYINSRRNHQMHRKNALITLILAVLAFSGCSQSPYTPELGQTRNKTFAPPLQRFAGVSVVSAQVHEEGNVCRSQMFGEQTALHTAGKYW